MLTPAKSSLRGLIAGSVAAVLLLLGYWTWVRSAPQEGEGAFDAIGAIAYVLGFPVTFGLDRLFGVIESAGPQYILSTLTIALMGVPLNWSLIGFVLAAVSRKRKQTTG